MIALLGNPPARIDSPTDYHLGCRQEADALSGRNESEAATRLRRWPPPLDVAF